MSQLSEDVDRVLRDTGEALASLCEGSSASAATDASLNSLWSAYDSLKRRATEQQCTVAVLALAKSGKSTLLNAILCDSILPSNNVPETARIIAISHADVAEPRLSYTGPDGAAVEVEGAAAIHEHLRQLNASARGSERALAADERPLEIEVAVAALAGLPAGSPGSRLTILDTPGPNEAGEDALRYKVERLAEGLDALLYLLDYTKLKTNEEEALFQRLRELNPSLLRRLCTRCFFAVNKKDEMERQDGMGDEETRQYVADLITQQLNVPGFQLRPEQVFMVSALEALRARCALRPQASEDDSVAFRQLAYGRAWKRHTDPQMVRREAEEVLAGSGLPELEAAVLGFLGRRAAVLRQVALLDDAERLLAQVHNLTSAASASLRQGAAALAEQAGALQARLARTLAEFEEVGAEVGQLEALVVDEVQARMGRLQEQLLDHMARVLSPRTPPGGSLSHGRWPAVWSMVRGLLGRGTAEPQGISSEEELQCTLSNLHSMIYLQIETETREFWHGLEQATNARQRQLVAALNGRLSALGAAIEADVSGALGCRLDAVDMRLRPPTAEQFHVDLQALLKRGIQKQEREEVEQQEREHVVYKKREANGLCQRSEWWEPTRETRTEEVRVRRTQYVADPAAIRAYFEGVVRDSVAASVRSVRAFVHAYLAERLAEARGRLQQYAASYTVAMSVALDTARLGESERLGALRRVEERYAAVGELLERVQGLQASAEEMLEGWVEELGDWPQDSAAPGSAATLAALAALQRGQAAPPAELAASQTSAAGSSAAEVAAAYAVQQVAKVEVEVDVFGPVLASREAEGEEAAQLLAEVALHAEREDAAAAQQAPSVAALLASSGEDDGDWTLLTGGGGEEEPLRAEQVAGEHEAPLAC